MRQNLLREIQSLHGLGASIKNAGSIGEVLQAAAESLARLLPCDRVTLIEINPGERKVGLFAGGGAGKAEVVTSVTFDELQEGLSGWVLREGKSALSPKGTPDPRESPSVQNRRKATHCGAIVVVPLTMAGDTFGTLTAIHKESDPDFTEADVATIELFASYCAVVIQNARHYEALKKTTREVEALNVILQKRNALKDNLFSILAHDLRGPLGNSVMLMEALLDESGLAPDLRELVSVGHEASHQTYNLLENLLSWVRSQIDETPADGEPLVVRATLDTVVDWLLPQGVRKGVSITVDCPDGLSVRADVRSFETIIRNLVSNALKYSRPHSRIDVRAKVGEGLEVEVEDHGLGIPADKVAYLFGGKKQHSNPGTEGESGNGLGLMFCSDLAHSMGGHLEVESVEGQGSLFRLVLPATSTAKGLPALKEKT